MNLKKYRLLTVFLLTACSQTITDGNLWELNPNSIQSGDRFEVVNRISQRTLKIKLCGVIPAPSSQKYLESILKKRPDRLILVGNGKDGDLTIAEVYINQHEDDPIPGKSRIHQQDKEEISVNALMIKTGIAKYRGNCENDMIYRTHLVSFCTMEKIKERGNGNVLK